MPISDTASLETTLAQGVSTYLDHHPAHRSWMNQQAHSTVPCPAVRDYLRADTDAMARIRSNLNDLGGPLSPCRLLDIAAWMDARTTAD